MKNSDHSIRSSIKCPHLSQHAIVIFMITRKSQYNKLAHHAHSHREHGVVLAQVKKTTKNSTMLNVGFVNISYTIVLKKLSNDNVN